MPVEEQMVCRLLAASPGEKVFAEESAPEHQPRDREFHVKHLRLDVRLDFPRRRIAGASTLTLSPINDGLRKIELDAVDLKIQGVRAGRKALPFDHRDGVLTVRLPRAYKEGQEFTLSVRYAAKPRKGLFFVRARKGEPPVVHAVWTQGEAEDNKFWFPCYDAPNDRMTSEVVVAVPKGWTAISNGRLVSVKKAGERWTFHWRQDVPHVNYLIALAAAKYDIREERWDGVPLQYYVPRGRAKYVPLTFGETKDMIAYFSEVTGYPYPYPKYAQVVIPRFTFGGMENTSMTTLTDLALHDERARPNYRSEPLLAHELAHQWFGDLVTMKAWPHLWLNEGFASYFDPLWHEHRYGRDDFEMSMRLEAEGYFEEDANSYRRAIVSTKFHSPEDMFDSHTYNKGACVLHMLRYVLGDDLWWKAVRHYTQKHAEGVVETSDFKLAIEEATGRSLDWFFQEWVYRGGHPEFEVSWSYDDAAKLVAVTAKQKQEVKDLTPLFRMPVNILVANGKQTRRERVEITEKEHTFHIPLRAKPDMVLFDPHDWILKKLTFEKGKEELLHQLEKGPTITARIQACEGLGKIYHDDDVIAALRRALRRDPFWGVRRAAAKALGELGTEEAKRVLLTDGVKRADGRVRRAVAEALGKFREDDAAFSALLRLYTKDPKDYVASAAGQALAATRHGKALESIRKGMERQSHASTITRLALRGLAALRDPKGIPICMRHARRRHPWVVRREAIAALGRFGDYLEPRRQEIREFLVPFLRDDVMHVRNATCAALATVGDPAAIPELQKVAQNDIMGMTQRAARRAIRRIRDKRAEAGKKGEFVEDVEKLKDENLKLKQRLAKLEGKVEALGTKGR